MILSPAQRIERARRRFRLPTIRGSYTLQQALQIGAVFGLALTILMNLDVTKEAALAIHEWAGW